MASQVQAKKSLMDMPQSVGVVFPVLTLICYLSPIPVAHWLAQPNGFVSKTLVPLLSSGVQRISSETAVEDPRKIIVVLTGAYIFLVYICSAVMSVTAQFMANKEGWRNKEPRAHKRNVTHGLPLRMVSAHEALYDIFPAYAVTAALVTCFLSSPGSRAAHGVNSDASINGLVLHVFLKLAVYVPAYLLDVDVVRSVSHMCSISALLVALWNLVVGT